MQSAELLCEKCGKPITTGFKQYMVEAQYSEDSSRKTTLPIYLCSECNSAGWRPTKIIMGRVEWENATNKPQNILIEIEDEITTYGWTCRIGNIEISIKDTETLNNLRKITNSRVKLRINIHKLQ